MDILRLIPLLVVASLTPVDAADAAAEPVRDDRMAIACWACAGGDAGDPDEGGFAPCDNMPTPIRSEWTVAPNRLQLLVLPDEVSWQGCQGIAVALANTTSQTIVLPAQDSMLRIVEEALAEDGWKPIEHLPASDCGNSYHHVALPPSTCWRFVAPRYAGCLETRLRFSFAYDAADGTVIPVTSPEFAGSIDPRQWDASRAHGFCE